MDGALSNFVFQTTLRPCEAKCEGLFKIVLKPERVILHLAYIICWFDLLIDSEVVVVVQLLVFCERDAPESTYSMHESFVTIRANGRFFFRSSR